VKLPNPFRREKPRRGSSVARGSIPDAGGDLASRLLELGVPVHDPIRDALEAGRFGTASSAGGGSHAHLVAGDETPRGAKVTKAEPIAPLMEGGGFTWNGPEDGK
jgi:hypothetical protein